MPSSLLVVFGWNVLEDCFLVDFPFAVFPFAVGRLVFDLAPFRGLGGPFFSDESFLPEWLEFSVFEIVSGIRGDICSFVRRWAFPAILTSPTLMSAR